MDIKTKYNLGDEVYFLTSNNDVEIGKIIKVEAFCDNDGMYISYRINVYNTTKYENEVFRTKEDVIEYWTQKQKGKLK